MADDQGVAAIRLAAATDAICKQRSAMLGISTCRSRGRQCPWPGSCDILADAVVRRLIEHDCIERGVFKERR